MKKQLSKRIGAILTMAAMLITMLPAAIPVMAEGETVSYITGDGQYIPVQELEHYALTVDTSTKNNMYISVTVAFLSEASDDAPVTMNAHTYNNKATNTYSSLVRVMYNENNVFNFTTPKGCKYIKVSAVEYGDITATELSLPITSIEITNEVINNGAVNFTGNASTTAKILPGWYSWSNSVAGYYDSTVSNEYFVMDGNTSTNLYQTLTLKEGSVYCLSFKFAQKEASGESLANEAPTLYFSDLIGTIDTVPATKAGALLVWDTVEPLDAAPEASDWKEYKIYFVATASGNTTTYTGTEGLVQATMYPRNYKGTTGTPVAYYDDFSIEEIDEGSYTGYIGGNAQSVSAKSLATKVRYHYTQKTEGQTQKLINVKYENGAISSVGVTEVGKDLAVGASANYDITIGNDTSKIFLWDGVTLVPQRLPIEDYVITD